MNDNNHSNNVFTLSACERLKKRNEINTLFQYGKAFSFAPLRVIYHIYSCDGMTERKKGNVRVGISVPKKYQKKAHNRNLIKRRIKEQYRLQKYKLMKVLPINHRLDLFIVYQNDEITDSKVIAGSILQIINKLENLINKNYVNT